MWRGDIWKDFHIAVISQQRVVGCENFPGMIYTPGTLEEKIYTPVMLEEEIYTPLMLEEEIYIPVTLEEEIYTPVTPQKKGDVMEAT